MTAAVHPSICCIMAKSRKETRSCAEIKKLRKELGITQKELADKIGVSCNHMCAIEKGDVNITVALMEKIASAVGRKFLFFFWED